MSIILVTSTKDNPWRDIDHNSGGRVLVKDYVFNRDTVCNIIQVRAEDGRIMAHGQTAIVKFLGLCKKCFQPVAPCTHCHQPHTVCQP